MLAAADRGEIPLGSGKRALIPGGKLDPKHLITLPGDRDAGNPFLPQARLAVEVLRLLLEVNLVLRGSVYPAEEREAMPGAQDVLGDVTARVLPFEDVYAGKIVAALDRQHPRDLYDVMLLLDTEGLTERLLDAFVAYLASHDRPMAEVLAPREKDFRPVFERDFAGM